MRVWVGWIDGGSYSDKYTDVEGVFATREAGMRYARQWIERKIAAYEAKITEYQGRADGSIPRPTEGWWATRSDEAFRADAQDELSYLANRPQPWQQLLENDWLGPDEIHIEQSDSHDYMDEEIGFEIVPQGHIEEAIAIESEELEWRFCLMPFDVEE